VTKININKDEEKEKSTLVQVSGGNNFLYPNGKFNRHPSFLPSPPTKSNLTLPFNQSATNKSVHIISKLQTSNGIAEVNDKKQLSDDGTFLVQELSIRNLKTNETNTTIRYWMMHDHIDVDDDMPVAQTYEYDDGMGAQNAMSAMQQYQMH